MNKTNIEWTNYTLNCVVGCSHNCPYCYARKQAKRFQQRCKLCYDFIPHPHLERLNQLSPTQTPAKIFMDSMFDWNCNQVKIEWLVPQIKKMRECKQHTFQILTKRPKRYNRFYFPINVWLGTTITSKFDTYCIHDLLDNTDQNNIHFVSIEPILSEIPFWFYKVDWIIIGAETGNRIGKVIPKKEWIEPIIENARSEGIPLFLKRNLGWKDTIQEFPNNL